MRITKVTTRNGDGGKTNLAKGESVLKSDNIIHCLGEVDELSSIIGVCLSFSQNSDITEFLKKIQNNLFDIGGHISMKLEDNSIINENMISDLDEQINYLNQDLEPLKEFILPSGDHFSSNLHVARAITRRAERSAVTFTAPVVAELGVKSINVPSVVVTLSTPEFVIVTLPVEADKLIPLPAVSCDTPEPDPSISTQAVPL